MIVFDASTLILIAKVELLDLFLGNVGVPVAIPAEVERECCRYKKTLDSMIIRRALDNARIKTIAVRNRHLVSKLRADFNLGEGEAEAITLAVNENAQLLGIDDKIGISACKLMGVPFTTAVAILTRCREKGLLESPEALEKLSMLAKHGRYKVSIIDEARRRLEANP